MTTIFFVILNPAWGDWEPVRSLLPAQNEVWGKDTRRVGISTKLNDSWSGRDAYPSGTLRSRSVQHDRKDQNSYPLGEPYTRISQND
ncbi:MAG: hypothetical protein MUO42_06575 [Anaerolineaceae bacterium]|nr:hypothetical protein [Anaerolineaceae bacterium]